MVTGQTNIFIIPPVDTCTEILSDLQVPVKQDLKISLLLLLDGTYFNIQITLKKSGLSPAIWQCFDEIQALQQD